MSRFLRLLLAGIMLVAMVPVSPTAAAPAIRVTINGDEVIFRDVQPLIKDGRVLVPTRTLAESLGASISWYPNSRTVYMTNTTHTAQVTVNSGHAWSDAWMFQLDVPPIILHGRTMLPARFVAEALGASVRWDAATRTVVITRGQEPPRAPEELRQAAAYLTPFVSVDDQGRFSLYRPEGVWFPVSPSAVRQLRDSMQAVNQLATELPINTMEWERADELTLLAAKRLDLRVGGPDWDGWKEPVFTVAATRRPTVQVKVHWWLAKWYLDEATASDIRWLLATRAGHEGFAAYWAEKAKVLKPLSYGLAGASFLLWQQSQDLEKCMSEGGDRGVIIYVLYPRNYGWCEPR